MELWQENRRNVGDVSKHGAPANDLCTWPKDSWKCPLLSKSLAASFNSRWDENIFTRLPPPLSPQIHLARVQTAEPTFPDLYLTVQ